MHLHHSHGVVNMDTNICTPLYLYSYGRFAIFERSCFRDAKLSLQVYRVHCAYVVIELEILQTLEENL